MSEKENQGEIEFNNQVDDREVATAEELVQEPSEVEFEKVQLKSGKIVVLRPLNRKQGLRFKGNKKMPRDVFEQRIISIAMVAPKMTPAMVSKWQDRDPAGGDLHKITDAILRISGMKEIVEDSKREQDEDSDSDL